MSDNDRNNGSALGDGDWPNALLNPALYPHPVDKLQLIETHISWVILTGPFAYKVKKPLDLGFLDFTTAADREYYCYRELELNRRFSPDIYLDVVPISGTPQTPDLAGQGQAFDFAVKMRQFDNQQLADHLAQKGLLTDDLARQLAKTLARVHQELPSISEDCEYGYADDFFSAAMENFTQIRAYSLSEEILTSLTKLQDWMRETYQYCKPLLDSRRQEGYVKDCHGDCHLGNIVLIDDKITLFDCIEFNDSFRINDTVAEAAFLSMDLCARELAQQSQRFINTYLEYTGDYHALPVLNLFRCYDALVRAKVNLLRLPKGYDSTITRESQSDFYRYVQLAERFTVNQSVQLILMHGLSGSGKSYLAEKIASQRNAIRIRSDVERKRLFHLEPHQSGTQVTNLYSEETTRTTFERLLILSSTVIDAGFNCIVDATFLTQSSRQPFLQWAISQKIPVIIAHCVASESVILQRLQQRTQEANDPSDADSEIYQQQKEQAEPFAEQEHPYVITIDTEQQNCDELIITQLTN